MILPVSIVKRFEELQILLGGAQGLFERFWEFTVRRTL